MEELKNKKILLVDDERELLKMTKAALQNEGFYNIYTAESCQRALEIIQSQPIALILLDVMLPDGDGFSLFQQIREISQTPVIFLTAKGEAPDKIHGLGLGADDYIVKPFLMKELTLRITAVLRRTCQREVGKASFYLGEKHIDLETASVTSQGQEKSFTPKEFILLKKLYENKNRIVTNDALCMAAWGDEYYGYENTLMVHISRLRQKIEENPSAPKYIITAKGLGYKLVIKDE